MHIKTQRNKPSVSVNWNRSSNTWYRSFNELESPNDFFNVGDRRNLNSPYNIGRLLDKDHRFITLDFTYRRYFFQINTESYSLQNTETGPFGLSILLIG